MSLSIDSLKSMGAFTGAPVEKEITWQQGEDELKATVYVRPLSYASAVSDVKSLSGKHDAIAGRIAASICDEKGRRIFTPEIITGVNLDGTPVLVLDDEGNPVQAVDDEGCPLFHVDGSPQWQEQGELDGNLTMALLAVIAEVNNLGKSATSRKKKKSGTNSPSTALAETP